MRFKALLLSSFVWLCFNKVWCQQTVFNLGHFNSGFVQAFCTDGKGYLWVGSDNGLIKFDGSRQIIYRHDDTQKLSLCNNDIRSLITDKKGRLWIATMGGISLYNDKMDNFVNFYHIKNNKNSIVSNEVLSLAMDTSGNIWAGCTGGLTCITSRNDKYEIHNFLKDSSGLTGITDHNAWVIAFDKNNIGWVATQKPGINLFDASLPLDKIHFIKVDHLNKDSIQIQKQVNWIYIDNRSGKTWLLSNQGQIIIVNNENVLRQQLSGIDFLPILNQHFSDKITKIANLTRDYQNYYWLASEEEGVFRFNLNWPAEKPVVSDLSFISKKQNAFSDYEYLYSTSIYPDLQGNIWLGRQTGFSKYYSGNDYFKYPEWSPLLSKSANLNIVAVMIDDERIWLADNSNHVTVLEQDKTSGFILKRNAFDSSSAEIRILGIIKSKNGNIWFSTSEGIFIVTKNSIDKFFKTSMPGNKTPSIIANVSFSDSVLKTKLFYQLIETESKQIIAASAIGCYTINESDYKINRIFISNELTGSDSRIRALFKSSSNEIWIGTDGGVFRLNKNADSATALKLDFKLKQSITNVQCFAEDLNHNIWIGTKNGLLFADCKNKTVFQSSVANAQIASIEPDSSGRIWVNTDLGIYSLKQPDDFPILFNEQFDISINKSLSPAHGQLPDHTILMGGEKGLIFFNPDKITADTNKAPIVISEISIKGQSILLTPKSPQDSLIRNDFLAFHKIILEANRNDFIISFEVLNYNNNSGFAYQYRLLGYDSAWIDNEKKKDIVFQNMSSRYQSVLFPGTYSLQIRFQNANGTWTTMNEPLSITIKSALFRSFEFLGFMAATLLAIVIYIVRYLSQVRLREQLAKQEKLLAVERERNRISRDLHDDLGAGLSSVAMMTNQMKELVTDEEAQDRAWEISNEATDLVTRMREIIWSMSSKNDTVENLIAYINKYSKTYIEKNYLQFSIYGDTSFQHAMMDGDVRRNIFLVVKETLHNIIKHSGATEVVLNYSIVGNHITLQISDNGKGFDMAGLHRFGNGLANMKLRMQNAGGSYQILSEPGRGTTTILEIIIA